MGWFGTSGPSHAYGVDLQGERLLIVEATRRRRALRFATVLDAAVDPETIRNSAAASSILARVIQGEAVVAAAMPAGEATLRWLQTPFTSRRKAARVLPSLLDIQLPFPVEECRCVYPRLEAADEGGVRALAIAVRETDLARRLDRLADCGIEPTHVDHEALALWSGAGGLEDATDDAYRMVAYLGPDRLTLASGSGGRLLSAHGLRWSGDPAEWAALLPRIAHVVRSRCPDSDRLVDWWWTGPLAAEDERTETLEQDLASRRAIRFRRTEQPATFLARCLAARALREEEPGWNLRRDGAEHAAVRRTRERRAARRMAAGLALAAILAGVNVGWRVVLDGRNRALDQALRRIAAELTGLPERAIEPGLARHVVDTHRREPGRPTDPFARSLWGGAADPLFRAVEGAWREGVNLARVEFQQGRLTVRGFAADESAGRRYAAALEAAGGAVALDLGGAGEDGTVAFTVEGEFGNE